MGRAKNLAKVIIIAIFITLGSTTKAHAETPHSSDYIEGVILEILETKAIPPNLTEQAKTYQKLKVKAFESSGPKVIETDNNAYQLPKPKTFS